MNSFELYTFPCWGKTLDLCQSKVPSLMSSPQTWSGSWQNALKNVHCRTLHLNSSCHLIHNIDLLGLVLLITRLHYFDPKSYIILFCSFLLTTSYDLIYHDKYQIVRLDDIKLFINCAERQQQMQLVSNQKCNVWTAGMNTYYSLSVKTVQRWMQDIHLLPKYIYIWLISAWSSYSSGHAVCLVI